MRAAWQPWPVAQVHSPAIAAHVRAGRWDVAHVHGLSMMRYRPADTPVVFDAADVMTSVTQMLAAADSRPMWRLGWRFETHKTRRFEGAAARVARAVTVPTWHDAELFERLGARRVVVVPNGVDLDATPFRSPGPGAGIVLISYLAWRPNLQAALELRDEILPRIRARLPAATLDLVGAGAPAELLAHSRPGVSVAGQVDDVLPHLRGARVSVMPVRAGGGSRLKVLEALAAGVPVVATPFAVSGIDVRHRTSALIAESPTDLAELAIRVIEDDELAARLARAGRRLVEQRYGWSTVAQPLVDLHRELSDPARRPA
jgi:glycosyltransferase involved in cell wall biosynthesis